MNELLKNSTRLLSANVIAQVIGLLVYPILTRIYTPEDFGLLNLFLSIGSVLTLIGTAEYQYAIVLPKEEKKAIAILQVGFTILLTVCTLVLFVCFFLSNPIANLLKTPELASWLWMMPIFVLFTGTWTIINYYLTRIKDFRLIGKYQISQSMVSAGSKIGLNHMGIGSGGLISGTILGAGFSLIYIFIVDLIKGKQIFNQLCTAWCSREERKVTAKEYSNFPKYTLPRGFVNMLIGQLPVLWLTPVFGTKLVGYWGMAILLGFAPISMITRSLYQTFYQHISYTIHQQKSVKTFFVRFISYVTLITIPAFIGLWFILPWITETYLGQGWQITGEYIRWMLPWVYVSILVGCTGFVADIFFQQKIGLYFEILLALLRVAGVGIGVAMKDFTVSIAGYSIGSAVAITAQFAWMMHLVRVYERQVA